MIAVGRVVGAAVVAVPRRTRMAVLIVPPQTIAPHLTLCRPMRTLRRAFFKLVRLPVEQRDSQDRTADWP
jgi:hypothetical protein